MRILFLCTANACRSPFAEQLARSLLPRDVEVLSAGTHATAGGAASWSSIVAARAHGLDLSAHQRRPLDAELARTADRIYAFERKHIEHVAAAFPEAAGRALLLGEIPGGPGGEIPDPVGGSAEDITFCYGMIEHALRALAVDLEHAPPDSGGPGPTETPPPRG